MAQIISLLKHLPVRTFLLIFHLAVMISFFQPATAQSGKKRIDIQYADSALLERDKTTGKDWQRLLGNVRIKHNEILMQCDSCHFFPDRNQVKAFSRILIEQGDTLDMTGDYLFYDGTTEIANLTGNVVLINKETRLRTNRVSYFVNERIAEYPDSGRITNGDNILTSLSGKYYVADDLFHFKDSVKIVNPDYIMTGDTMDYNTKTETAFFTGPSEMEGDSIYLYCEKGWYDTKNNITRIWKNAVIDNRQQVVRGDSLFYNDNTGYGESFGNVSITDTTNNVIVTGNYAWYYKNPEKFMVTDKALFIQVSKEDSLFLHADTINAVTVTDLTGNTFRLMRAYYGCRIFSNDFQGRCDSLSYSFQDSVIRLYDEPVIWSEENQLRADSVAIFTKNRQADRLELYNSAFITSEVDKLRYNQIKGRRLTGYFKYNALYKITIDGNGESLYYLPDEKDIVGENRVKCSRMDIFLEEGKIKDIFQYQPEGIIDPPASEPQQSGNLEGFSWLDSVRPLNRNDVFRKIFLGADE